MYRLKQTSKPQRMPPSSRYGKVHILVNNAGVAGGRGYGHWTDAGWNWVLGVNLMAVIWGIEIFGPLIEAHGEGGQIVSTASVFGLIAGGSPQYDVSKYGVVALSEGLRKALAPRKIGVSVLCPGVVRTQIFNLRRNVPQRFVGKIGSCRRRKDRSPMPSRHSRSGSTNLASIRSMSANWFARQSKMTGPTSSPTPSTKPIDRQPLPRERLRASMGRSFTRHSPECR